MKLIRIQEALLTPDLLTTPHQTPYHQTSACSPGQILPFKLYINKTPMANPYFTHGKKIHMTEVRPYCKWLKGRLSEHRSILSF